MIKPEKMIFIKENGKLKYKIIFDKFMVTKHLETGKKFISYPTMNFYYDIKEGK